MILELRPAAWGQVCPPYGQTHPNIANVATLQTASNFWGLAKPQTDGLGCRITSLWPENDRAGETTPQSGMSLLENPSFNPHESRRHDLQIHYIRKIP